MTAPRCEGYRRNGGAFTLGPASWEQCKNDAVVFLDVKNPDGSKVERSPACQVCWDESKTYPGIVIMKEELVPPEKQGVTPDYLSKLLGHTFSEGSESDFPTAVANGCFLLYDTDYDELRLERGDLPILAVSRHTLLDRPEAAKAIVTTALSAYKNA